MDLSSLVSTIYQAQNHSSTKDLSLASSTCFTTGSPSCSCISCRRTNSAFIFKHTQLTFQISL